MNKTIIALSVLMVSCFTGSAYAAQVTCASTDGKYRECPLDGSGDIVMKTQLSKTNCTKNQTWGETANGVYVKGGCRAIFETMSMGPQKNYGNNAGNTSSGQVTCASSGGEYKECTLSGSGDIVMKQQLSKTACIKNQTWGETGDGVYVKGGCRAIFGTASSNSRNSSGNRGNDFDDLIGAKAAGGETELNSRGYEYVSTDTVNNRKVAHWWTPGRKSCIEVTTSDGRYSNIRDVGKGECY